MLFVLHAGVGTFKDNVEGICASALKKIRGNFNKSTDFPQQEEQNTLVQAIMELEKSQALNCGFGSNLTEAGTVECEAAFMCSPGLAFGAVAAVTNCGHPSFAAQTLADPQKSNSAPNGLIAPMVLVGKGAEHFCKALSIGIVENNQLLRTEDALRNHALAMKLHAKDAQGSGRLDTVGGVSINLDTGAAEACVSSGGIMLKKEGRLGHSSHFGAAIWAEKTAKCSIAVSLSGCGEALIRTRFAERLSEHMLSCDLESPLLLQQFRAFLDEKFTNSRQLAMFPLERRLMGGIVLISNSDLTPIFISFHNTHHLPFAFLSSNGKISKMKSTNEKVGEFNCLLFNL